MDKDQIWEQKDKILGLLQGVYRPGMDELCRWLETTDFFTAPASANNHSNFEGGLACHSLKVYEAMTANIFQLDPHYSPDSVKVVALLHDICKIHFYEIATRNVEKAPKCWVKVPYYKHAYPSPTLDHAVRSCRLIEKHMRLEDDEYLAIRWHMSAFSESDFEGRKCMAEAMRIPLVLALAQADQEASFLRGDSQMTYINICTACGKPFHAAQVGDKRCSECAASLTQAALTIGMMDEVMSQRERRGNDGQV